MMHHNHSVVLVRRLTGGLPKNKTGGLIFGSLDGSSKGGSYLGGGLIFGEGVYLGCLHLDDNQNHRFCKSTHMQQEGDGRYFGACGGENSLC